jgi:hypothetical protein
MADGFPHCPTANPQSFMLKPAEINPPNVVALSLINGFMGGIWLAVMNLIPVSPLSGGHVWIVLLGYEKGVAVVERNRHVGFIYGSGARAIWIVHFALDQGVPEKNAGATLPSFAGHVLLAGPSHGEGSCSFQRGSSEGADARVLWRVNSTICRGIGA